MAILTFPTLTGLSFPVTKAPVFKTIEHEAVSGVTTSQALQPYARYRYSLPFEFLRSDDVNVELQTLMSFYQACQGKALPFHFLDPDDSQATVQALGVGDGANRDFPFLRTLGSVSDPVQDVQAVTQVRVNGVATAAYVLLATAQWGTTYGLRMNVAPPVGQAVDATFSFRWLCRFEEDEQEFSKFMKLNGKGLWEAREVRFKTELQ